MTNSALLRDKIKESGYKLQYLANSCGLSYQGFIRKVDNKSYFNAHEIVILRKILKLSPDEIELIFFTG